MLREINFELNPFPGMENTVMGSFGRTRVLTKASVSRDVPRWLKDSGSAWVTAEYGMLPSSTPDRFSREAAKGKQTGRTVEIQRLIGRSLRAAVAMDKIDPCQITIDCDVIVADGGTRTCAITAGMLSLVILLDSMDVDLSSALPNLVTALSVGVVNSKLYVDLDYEHDSNADLDLNLVMTHRNELVEIQGTAEGQTIDRKTLDLILDAGEEAIAKVRQEQLSFLNKHLKSDLPWEI